MSNKLFTLLPGLLICLLAIPSTAQAQGGHTLQGKVLLSNGAPPARSVRVTLTFNGVRVHEVFTDLSGRFSFTGLRRGRYQLEAEGDGEAFETTRVYAEVSAFGAAPQSFTQNIQLRAIKTTKVPPVDTVSAEVSDPSLPELAREEYKKGSRLASDNKPEEAVKHFQQAAQVAPQFYLAHLSLGDQCLKLRRYDDAAAAYLKAKELRPDRAEPLNGVGAVLTAQAKYADAMPYFRAVVELRKPTSTTYLYLGLAETMTGSYTEAESDLMRAIDLGKPPVARIYLANLYELKGEPAKAIAQLRKFLDENPETTQANLVRGAIEKLRKKMSENK